MFVIYVGTKRESCDGDKELLGTRHTVTACRDSDSLKCHNGLCLVLRFPHTCSADNECVDGGCWFGNC